MRARWSCLEYFMVNPFFSQTGGPMLMEMIININSFLPAGYLKNVDNN